MKDKEINVTKCQYHNKNGKCRIPHFENGIKYVSCNCDEWYCDFKQLKHKEQECEKLKEENLAYKQTCEDLKNALDESMQECIDLAKVIEEHSQKQRLA